MKCALISIISFLSVAAMATPMDSLPKSVKAKHISFSNDNCDPNLNSESEVYDLGQGSKLYIVPCAMGAYQGYSYAYTVDQFDAVNPIIALSYDETVKGISSSFEHGEASYESKSKIFSTYSKGRGIGDCGQSSKSKVIVSEYGYVGIKTTEIRHKEKCDGKMNSWPVVFKQK